MQVFVEEFSPEVDKVPPEEDDRRCRQRSRRPQKRLLPPHRSLEIGPGLRIIHVFIFSLFFSSMLPPPLPPPLAHPEEPLRHHDQDC